MERSERLSIEEAFIQKLNTIVFANLNNEQFGAEQLASFVGLSRSQIHRKLKRINGKSLTQFIREVRLKEAHRLLEEGIDTASEIAYNVGFGSPTYFYKCFHEFYDYTPGEVKRKKSKSSDYDFKKKVDKEISIIPLDGRKQTNINVRSIQSKFKLFYYLLSGLLLIIFGLIVWDIFQSKQIISAKKMVANHVSLKSLAILPIKDLSQNHEKQFFSDGIMEEMISHLQQLQNIIVKSRSEVEAYRNTTKNITTIAGELNVDYVLKGSVINYGENFRLITQLIDGKTGDELWTYHYEGIFSDANADVQRDLAKTISSSLHAKIIIE